MWIEKFGSQSECATKTIWSARCRTKNDDKTWHNALLPSRPPQKQQISLFAYLKFNSALNLNNKTDKACFLSAFAFWGLQLTATVDWTHHETHRMEYATASTLPPNLININDSKFQTLFCDKIHSTFLFIFFFAHLLFCQSEALQLLQCKNFQCKRKVSWCKQIHQIRPFGLLSTQRTSLKEAISLQHTCWL